MQQKAQTWHKQKTLQNRKRDGKRENQEEEAEKRQREMQYIPAPIPTMILYDPSLIYLKILQNPIYFSSSLTYVSF